MSKTILLTGAAGGFGRLVLEKLIEQGATVYAVVRGGPHRVRNFNDANLTAALEEGRLRVIDLDLSAFDVYAARLGESGLLGEPKLDAVVNIAGFSIFGPMGDVSLSELREQFELNVFSPFLLIQPVLPLLIAARGRVINMSSLAGRLTLPFYGAYSGTKFALEAMTEAMAHELQPYGIQVALVEPGGYRTGIVNRLRFTERSFAGASPFQEAITQLRTMLQSDPSAQGGDPREVSNLILRLLAQRRLRLRYPIGRGARWVVLLRKLLPERWVLALTRWGFQRRLQRASALPLEEQPA